MNEPAPESPSLAQTPPRPPRGGGNCFLKGCLIVTILLMLLGIIIGGTGWYIFRSARPFLDQDPAPLPKFAGGEPAYAAVQAKLGQFHQTVAAGQPATLSLTADDLNALIAYQPELAEVRDHLVLAIVNNQIVAQISFPVNGDRSIPREQRLFCNARAFLDASYSSGDFTFLLARFETFDGRKPSATLLGMIRTYVNGHNQTFNRDFHDHPENYRDLKQLTDEVRTIVIQDNQIVATSAEHPRPASPEPSPTETSPVAGTPESR